MTTRIKISLLALGKSYLPLTFVARLPFSMLLIGSLTVVATNRDSLTLAGLCAACIGVANSLAAPGIGALADWHGQKNVIIVFSLLNALAMLLLTLLAAGSAPDFLLPLNALLLGATIPLIGPFSRGRDNAYVLLHVPASQQNLARTRLFSQESVLDEVGFVLGPVLVGFLSTLYGANIALITAAGWTVVCGFWFAHHRSQQLVAKNPNRVAISPFKTLLSWPLAVLFITEITLGMVFGSSLTVLLAVLKTNGLADQTGIWFGIMGVSSALCAFSVSWYPQRFSHNLRLTVFAGVTFAAMLFYSSAGSPGLQLAIALFIIGIGVGPVLVTGFTIGAIRSKTAHTTTVLAALSAGITLGQSLTTAVTGVLLQEFGLAAGNALVVVCAAALLAAALLNQLTMTKAATPNKATLPDAA